MLRGVQGISSTLSAKSRAAAWRRWVPWGLQSQALPETLCPWSKPPPSLTGPGPFCLLSLKAMAGQQSLHEENPQPQSEVRLRSARSLLALAAWLQAQPHHTVMVSPHAVPQRERSSQDSRNSA